MSYIPGHVYIIANKAWPDVVVSLQNEADPKDGTPCWGFPDVRETSGAFGQQWIITTAGPTVSSTGHICKLRNLHSGTYLDLDKGSTKDGALIQGHSELPAGSDMTQMWRLEAMDDTYYRLQNVASQTYLHLTEGNPTKGTMIQGWQGNNTANQEWKLRRISRDRLEIYVILNANGHKSPALVTYPLDRVYIVLRESIRDTIYKATNLKQARPRNEIFDGEEFSFVMKAAVSKWGYDNLRADGFAILWGFMFGQSSKGDTIGYNWYLNGDLKDIAFFDPLTGAEVVNPGHTGVMAVF